MEESGVTFKLETLVWMDENGNQCAEKHVSIYKVTHSLTYQEICFVMDKVGGSTSQKGDKDIGVRLMVWGKGMVPQNKTNAKREKMDAP